MRFRYSIPVVICIATLVGGCATQSREKEATKAQMQRYEVNKPSTPISYEQRRSSNGGIEWIACDPCDGPTRKVFGTPKVETVNRPISEVIKNNTEIQVSAREVKPVEMKSIEQKAPNDERKRFAVFFSEGQASIGDAELMKIKEVLRSARTNDRVTLTAYAWDEGSRQDMIRVAKKREDTARKILEDVGHKSVEISSIAAVEKVAPSKHRVNRTEPIAGAMYRRIDITFGG